MIFIFDNLVQANFDELVIKFLTISIPLKIYLILQGKIDATYNDMKNDIQVITNQSNICSAIFSKLFHGSLSLLPPPKQTKKNMLLQYDFFLLLHESKKNQLIFWFVKKFKNIFFNSRCIKRQTDKQQMLLTLELDKQQNFQLG